MSVSIITGDSRAVLATLPSNSFQCCVTSPPYFGLRDYDVAGQIGLEASPDQYIAEMVSVFAAVRRVLCDDGTLWLNIGDCYSGSGRGGYGGSASGLEGSTKGPDNSRIAREKQRAGATTFGSHKPKDLLMIPARVAMALQADGWWLRSAIIWHKPNAMPESVTDRPTSAYEHVFLLAKSKRYYYDADAIREEESVADWDNGSRVFGGVNKHGANLKNGHRLTGRVAEKRKRGVPPYHAQYASSDQSGLDDVGRGAGRNARNVWTISTRPFPEAHFATFPPELAKRCIKAGSRLNDLILDPFGGAGTTGLVADRLQRNATLIELNPEYADMARRRIFDDRGSLLNAMAAE